MEKITGKKKISENYKIVYRFLAAEMICYAIFLFLDFCKGTDRNLVQASLWIKWLSVIGCFSFVTFYKPVPYRKKEKSVVSTALFFTVFADFCLLMTDQSMIGVVCFLVVQTLYLYRLTMWNEEIVFYKRIIGRILCSVVIYFVFFWIGNIRSMEFPGIVLYFVSLIDNLTIAASICFYHVGSKRKSGCFFAGLCLLFLCDIQVAVHNADMFPELGILPFVSHSASFAALAMWIFYLPSQVLIALSGRLEK